MQTALPFFLLIIVITGAARWAAPLCFWKKTKVLVYANFYAVKKLFKFFPFPLRP